MAKIKLVMTGIGRGELFIDDMKVEGVRSVDIRAGVDELNIITLGIFTENVEVQGDFDIKEAVDSTAIGDEARRYRPMTYWELVKHRLMVAVGRPLNLSPKDQTP